MINEWKLDNVLLELGFDDFTSGTKLLRAAVKLYDPEQPAALTKEIYPAVAKRYDSTASRVERCIRHAVEKAWIRSDWETQSRYFGNAVDPQRGCPRNGEIIARLARVCADAD